MHIKKPRLPKSKEGLPQLLDIIIGQRHLGYGKRFDKLKVK